MKVPRWLTGKLHTVSVPAAQEAALVHPPLYRIRALKRHLVESLRDLREAKHPERLIQKRTAQPQGFAADVVQAGCTQCQGHCCRGGGEHAYLDDRTMARVRKDNPELDAAGVISLYVDSVAEQGFEGSCLFHGRFGCTLAKPLRAELCNTYYCNGLWDFLKLRPLPGALEVVAKRGAVERRAVVKAARVEEGAGWE